MTGSGSGSGSGYHSQCHKGYTPPVSRPATPRSGSLNKRRDHSADRSVSSDRRHDSRRSSSVKLCYMSGIQLKDKKPRESKPEEKREKVGKLSDGIKTPNKGHTQRVMEVSVEDNFFKNPISIDIPKKRGKKINFHARVLADERREEEAQLEMERMDWKSYHRLSVIHKFMDDLEQDFPSLCTTGIIGQSVEGRKLKATRVLGTRVFGAVDADSCVCIDDTSARMKRVYAHLGWGGKGSSDQPNNAFYRGPRPFSEPESAAMRDLFLNSGLKFKVYITLHSFGQIIIFPYACSSNLAPDYVRLLEGATVMSKKRPDGELEWNKVPKFDSEVQNGNSYVDPKDAQTPESPSCTQKDERYVPKYDHYVLKEESEENYEFNGLGEGKSYFVQKDDFTEEKDEQKSDSDNDELSEEDSDTYEVKDNYSSTTDEDFPEQKDIPFEKTLLSRTSEEADIGAGQVAGMLHEREIPYSVAVPDVTELLEKENGPRLSMPRRSYLLFRKIMYRLCSSRSPCQTMDWKSYHRLDSIYAFMDNLAAEYPYLCEVSVIGKSVEGRDLKLKNHSLSFFINLTIGAFVSYFLCKNHNYGFGEKGDEGSSDDPGNIFYRGPKAFSEPETAAVRNAIVEAKTTFKVYLSFHSYGEVIIFPWGYTSDPCPDYVELLEGGTAMAKAIHQVSGHTYKVGSTKDLMYYAAGTSIDWTYAVSNIPYSYMVELRGKTHRFLLPKEEIISTAAEVLNGVFRLMDFVDRRCKGTETCPCPK
ncbi:unnamed protein product [Chrysodeixis includens]|uniref:Peptidase M14 domain-containing protein n=1 Tax=Chrysodeixis includens TaxID=689277 RepID=A0A9N8L3M2_CHRIL|nr:unnamed protein product [Chrysodeixis includens]